MRLFLPRRACEKCSEKFTCIFGRKTCKARPVSSARVAAQAAAVVLRVLRFSSVKPCRSIQEVALHLLQARLQCPRGRAHEGALEVLLFPETAARDPLTPSMRHFAP